MKQDKLSDKLNTLITTWENEVIEFKEAKNKFDTDKIGCYFSALSNEANLRNLDEAWLVFGVHDSSRQVVGTNYRLEPGNLQSLHQQIASNTEPRLHFKDIHVLQHDQGRVVMMHIPAAPRGIPVAWKGHYYSRAGESLVSLHLDKQDEIRSQTMAIDWSAQLVPNATFEDLDGDAVQKAREDFARKHANRIPEDEVMNWPLATFLDRARVTQNGQVTRTALLLLGKDMASFKLSPHPAQLTWRLEGEESAYEHFSLPFLLTSTALYDNIRNIQVRILPENQLVAVEVSKYDQRIVMEALHNCIAHQDYTRNARIVVTEFSDRLVFENEGFFYEGKPDDYITGSRTPRRYRNPFLANAMVELNMIDTLGRGIRSIHVEQAKRFFPMPDYRLEEAAVNLTIYGRVIDSAYSRLLIQKTDLPLDEVLALDRVQKKLSISNDMVKRLRRNKLIEGRKPNFYVSANIAATTSQKADYDYIQARVQDDEFYAKFITDYLEKFDNASRTELDNLLIGKMSEVLDQDQKKSKIANLLTKLRKRGVIENTGSRKAPEWALIEKKQNKN